MAELGFWTIAAADPERVALVEADGTEHTAGQLHAACNQVVHGLRALGLRPGDVVATVLPNSGVFIEVLLAAQQAGWYVVPINHHLLAEDIAYITQDCSAKALISHERFATEAGKAAKALDLAALFAVGDVDGFRPYTELKAGQPNTPPADRKPGGLMNYTSGTTGRPKGVQRPLPDLDADTAAELGTFLHLLFGIEAFADNVHLTVAPLYHTAVCQFAQCALHSGHTLVLMDRWTPEGTLERIEHYRVTTTQMVPTMFHRLLQLPEDVRARYDTSTLRHVIHSAAPCPVPTKAKMMDWWGPVLWEYYAATEGGGTTATPQDWLAAPGTVGKPWPGSIIKILDESGAELPPGAVGTVWMQMNGRTFEYHGDPEKTRRSWSEDGFFTVGDAGELDEQGNLFLRDRVLDMIIVAGVNIYPAEIESVLLQHPAVGDCAVFGIPDDDRGEEIKATIQPTEGATAGPALEAELLEFCRDRLPKFKTPRSIDFLDDFPRDPSGKLYKRRLRDPYWAGHSSQLV